MSIWVNYWLYVGDREHQLYLDMSGFVPGLRRTIDRENLYKDVLDMYQEGDVVGEYPKGENAVDDRGVQRDMFSTFWVEAYIHLFEGAKTLIPMVQAGIDMSTFSVIGKIICHGYLACGLFPIRIALSSLILTMLGPSVTIPSNIVTESFVDYVSEVERLTLKSALAATVPFSSSMTEHLVNKLSRFGCRQIPTHLNLSKRIEDVARYEFCVKPAAALTLIHSGNPRNFKLFWEKKTASDVHALFYRMTVTPSKVLSLLDFSTATNESKSRISAT